MLITSLLENPTFAIFYLLAIVIAVSVHEFMHAKAADMLGDPTPDLQGRVTLDPRAHLDPLGSLLFLLVGFGWGKPVQFDPYNLDNPRRDAATISLAGPLSNFAMALISSGILYIAVLMDIQLLIVDVFLIQFIRVNIILGIFNLLPFAPLDGFKIVGGFLSDEQAAQWYSMERYGMYFLIFFLLPFAGGRSMMSLYISPIITFMTGILIP